MTKFIGTRISLPRLANAPSSPAAGDAYYDTVANTAYVYNGTSWVDLAASGGGSGDITDVVAGAGLTGGASTGSATLDVGAGTGITVNPDNVAIDTTVVARKTDKLSAFASTTSAELAGVVSDETGSGLLVFGTGPTLSLPVIDNPKLGYSTTVTSASTLTLTNTSGYYQFFTGSTASQVVRLPDASTMTLGQGFEFSNNSSQSISVQSSGGNVVANLLAGISYRVLCILTSGTTAASWDAEFVGATNINGTGQIVMSSSPTITTPDISGRLVLNDAIILVARSITSSGGTTAISATTDAVVIVTGTLGHTLTLPTVSSASVFFWIRNSSTQSIAVNTNAGSLVATVSSGQIVNLICLVSNGGSNASDWSVHFLGGSTATGTGASVFATSPSLVTPSLGAATATSINSTTIPSSATLVTTGDTGSVTSTMIANDTIVNADINSAAQIALSKLATDPLARANHTGTQTASTVSDFDTQVRTSKVTDLAAPTTSFSMNSQKITSLATPAADTDAATKGYVDGVANGLDVKASVRAATTANITLSGTQTIDTTVSVIAGDRVLVKNQTTSSQNGIYIVAAGAWTRATDADADAEVTTGLFTFVEEGTTNGDTGWVLATNNPITVGTTSLVFSQFSDAGSYTAGTGLTLAGTQFALGSVPNANTTATTSNTASTIVLRDGSGNTSAAQLSGAIPSAVTGKAKVTYDAIANRATAVPSPNAGDIFYSTDEDSIGDMVLTDSVLSTSTITAATPNSVKTAYDLASTANTTAGAAIPKSTVTTAGDIIYATGAAAVTRLGIGSTNNILTAGASAPAYQSLSTLHGTVATVPSQVAGDIVYASSGTALGRLGIGSTNSILTAGASAPAYQTLSTLTGTVATVSSQAAYDIPYATSATALGRIANGTTGQVFTATTSAAPSWANPVGSDILTSTSLSATTSVVYSSIPQKYKYLYLTYAATAGGGAWISAFTDTTGAGTFGNVYILTGNTGTTAGAYSRVRGSVVSTFGATGAGNQLSGAGSSDVSGMWLRIDNYTSATAGSKIVNGTSAAYVTSGTTNWAFVNFAGVIQKATGTDAGINGFTLNFGSATTGQVILYGGY